MTRSLFRFKFWIFLVVVVALVVGGRRWAREQPRVARTDAPDPAAAPKTEPEKTVVPAPPSATEAESRPARPPAAADRELSAVFPPSEMPVVATADGAKASLGYLAENGADLSKPIPSKHRVLAANEQVAARLIAWAQANDFEVRGPEVVREHVGTLRQRFDLVRTEILVPEQIEREGRLVLDAVRQIPGTYYQTWSGEIVR
jgi:hypothetical protein